MVLFVLLTFAATHITAVSIVTHHLLSFVRYVGAHGGKPFKSIEYLFLPAILGLEKTCVYACKCKDVKDAI